MSFFVVVVNFDKICLCLEIYCQAWGLRKVRAAVVEWKGGKGKGGKTAVFEEQVVHNSQFKSIRFSNTVMALLVFFQLLAGSFSWYQYSPNADTHSACSWKLYKCWYPFSLFLEVFHGTSILQKMNASAHFPPILPFTLIWPFVVNWPLNVKNHSTGTYFLTDLRQEKDLGAEFFFFRYMYLPFFEPHHMHKHRLSGKVTIFRQPFTEHSYNFMSVYMVQYSEL